MHPHSRHCPSPRLKHALPALVLWTAASAATGCLDRPIAPIEPRRTSVVNERLASSRVDKIDMLLVLDNSGSMSDKQLILADAVPDLVNRLVNPPCVDPTEKLAPVTPPSPGDECPAGLGREFQPVFDIHIGIITSSLGGHGASSSCNGTHNGQPAPTQNDRGRLVARTSTVGPGGAYPNNDIPTYKDQGYLAWDPGQKLGGTPNIPGPDDGEADLGIQGDPGGASQDTSADLNQTALIPELREMVKGVGQDGCGYEASLEAWYRFLIDPKPFEEIKIENGQAVPYGLDKVILEQRKDFLRPDSLLAIVLLSDENDCSIIDEKDNWMTADTTRTIEQDGNKRINLRCWDAKHRLGRDTLYPIARYRDALTEKELVDRDGQTFPNPLFSSSGKEGAGKASIRGAELVFFAGIVGVPWQDIARDKDDLKKGFKNAEELEAPVGDQSSTWDVVLGAPAQDIKPTDPHMVESDVPRSGKNPITGDAIAPPEAPNGADRISGHEWSPNPQLGGGAASASRAPSCRTRRGRSRASSSKRGPRRGPVTAPGTRGGGFCRARIRGRKKPWTRRSRS